MKSYKMYLIYVGILLIESTVIGVIFDSFIIVGIFACIMLLYIDIIGESYQNLLISIGQAIIAVVSRRSEYNADTFAHRLGYGNYLRIFLSKYAMDFEAFQPRTITEMLYASHPEPIKRINHLKSIEQQ